MPEPLFPPVRDALRRVGIKTLEPDRPKDWCEHSLISLGVTPVPVPPKRSDQVPPKLSALARLLRWLRWT
jgi:hypothetical protein